MAGDVIHASWNAVTRLGAIGPRHRRARQFQRFGAGSMIAFPPTVIFGEGRIRVGEGTTIGPLASISAGMPSQAGLRGDPVITIGDRCMLGKGIGIVGHERVEIGDDIWTGHYVYITDQNHGYEDVDDADRHADVEERSGVDRRRLLARSRRGGAAGLALGKHVVVAAGAIVAGIDVPDYSVVAGVPARVVRRYVAGEGWVHRPPDDA